MAKSTSLPNDEEKVELVPDSETTTKQFTFTIEIFRFLAYVGFNLMFLGAKIISDIWVFTPEEPDKLILGFIKPIGTRLVSETRIYEIFGFNHTCNVVDFNPAKEFAAIAIFFYILPIEIFLILSLIRNQLAYDNNEISALTFKFTKYTTPFCMLFNGIVHLWFVNSPQEDFPTGYGFIGHYVPYMLSQIALEFTVVSQLWYYIDTGKIPFGLPSWAAKLYARIFIVLATFSQACVLCILAGHPILDSKNDLTQSLIFQIIAKIVAFMTLICPAILSFWEWKFGGHPTTVTFGRTNQAFHAKIE